MTEKIICFINTEINDKHKISLDINVCKKKLFYYERMTNLNYEIGIMKNNKFISKLEKNINIKPRCANFTDIKNSIDPEKALISLNKDLLNYGVNIIISNNIKLILNTILAEAVRYNINIDFNKFIIYDLKNINALSTKLIKDIFFNIYFKKN